MANQVDLFLLGKTGHGKSSTGNSILGREAFQVSDSSNSETFEVQVGWCRRENRIIKVVDGPGLCETRLDRGTAAKKMTEDMSKGILQCPEGFHALVLVLKYGNRFTEEEWHTVEMLKSMFGESFIRDYCILVLTHGELFEINNRRTPNRTFQDWCREQTGLFQSMLQECDYRAVHFYNYVPEKSDSQLQELLSIVDNLKSRGVRYTSDIFAKAAAAREQLIVRENAPELRESIQEKIDLLVDGLERLKAQSELNDEVRKLIGTLKQDVRELETTIAVQDKGTGVLDSLKQVVGNLLQSIYSQEEALQERENKSKMETALATAQQQFEQSMAALREEVRKAKEKQKSGFWQKLGTFVVSLLSTGISSVMGGVLASWAKK